MLDAQMMEHLVNTGMNVEDAAMKAPEESVARFEKNFAQQLYKKKYPPKGHVYFRGETNSFICSWQFNCIQQTCKIPQVTAVNCWRRQQLLSQMIQSYSCFLQCRKTICLCQLNMQLWGGCYMFNYMKVNCWLSRIIELYFKIGKLTRERESGRMWSRLYCIIFHIW